MSNPANPSSEEVQHRRSWAKLIAKRRLTEFERAMTDPDLISLKQELIKIDLRITDIEERSRKGESRGAWKHVANFGKAFAEELAKDLPDLDKLRDFSTRLSACAEQGEQDWQMWDEVVVLIELRRKISDTERKFEELRNYKIPATDMVRIFDDLHAAVEAIVGDRTTRFQIFNEVRIRCEGEARSRAPLPFNLPVAYLGSPPTDVVDADVESEALEGE